MINIATFSSGQEDILERVHLEISSNSLKSIPTVARQDFLVIKHNCFGSKLSLWDDFFRKHTGYIEKNIFSCNIS